MSQSDPVNKCCFIFTTSSHTTRKLKKMSKNTIHHSSDSSEEELNVATPPVSKKMRSPPPAARSSTSKKRRHVSITPAATHEYSSYELFGTDSEDEKDVQVEMKSSKHDRASKGKLKKIKRKSSPPRNSIEPEPKKTTHASTSTAPELYRKASARDVFGSNSDDEQCDMQKRGKKTASAICSHFTKRVPHGVLRQTNAEKEGSHYIELKVYKCDEIKHIQPMNRWRHAIITIKNKSNADTEAWEHLTQFIKATRQEFKDCRPDIISGYS